MALLNITEYQYLDSEAKGRDVMVGRLPPTANQTQVDFSGGATQSAVFNGKTQFIRVWSDVDAYIKSGDSPTADANSTPITGKVAEYFGVKGGVDRLSVIAI